MPGQIRKRVSLILLHKGKLLGFRAQDPTSGKKYFFLPGGEIDPGESPEEAMRREAKEETGYEVKIHSKLSRTRSYQFHWDGKDYDCETIYYAGELESLLPEPVNDADYHQGVGWVDFEDLEEVFSYHSDVQGPVLELAQLLIEKEES